MTSSRVLVALLCFTTWVSVVQATHAPVSSCPCVGWSTTTVDSKYVVDYTLQTQPACRINAAIFLIKRGCSICSDPNSDWAMEVIQKVDTGKGWTKTKLLQESRQNKDGSTSTLSPAPSHQRRLTSSVSSVDNYITEEFQERKKTRKKQVQRRRRCKN